jgi:predicted HTH domain antitoxin
MLETAIELYYEGKLKQSEAARMANMTVKDFMAIAKERRCC